MSRDAVLLFFSLLALGAQAAVVLMIVTAVGGRATAGARQWLVDVVGPHATVLALVVAVVATAGSLYLSEVAHFTPCVLCWYQRIAMYPLAVLLGVAALRRDTSIRWYSVPVAGIGLAISAYHYLLERFPDSVASACSADVPCTTVWVWKFGFLSIPAMAGIGFAAIIALVLQSTPRGTAPLGDDPSTGPVRSGRATSEAAST